MKGVDFKDLPRRLDEEIDTAYEERYGYPSSAVDHVTSDEAKATTIRVAPR